jgi:hypothetical protein
MFSRRRNTHWGCKLNRSVKTDSMYNYCEVHNCKYQGCTKNRNCSTHLCFGCNNIRQTGENYCKMCLDKIFLGGTIIIVLMKKGLPKDMARYVYGFT